LARAIAVDSQALYTQRVRAAEIAGNDAGSLGSGELNWLARQSASSSEAADKPFFYAARVKAAQKAQAMVRVHLLLNAVGDSQDSDTARLPLFFALAAAGQDRLAVSALEPLLKTGLLESATSQPRVARQSEQASAENEQADEETSESPNSIPPAHSSAERGRIAATLAAAYANLQEFELSYQNYALAARLEKSRTTKAELIRKRDEMNAIVKRMVANRRRAPLIHKELDQPHQVEPRLTAANESPQYRSGKGGQL
jgi:hypothetical protein